MSKGGIYKMGQYYNIIIKQGKEKVRAFDRHIDGEYTMAKLTEHSWWLNPMVNAIAKKLLNTKTRVAWVGDYYNEDGDDLKLYNYAYPKNDKYEMLTNEHFSIDGLYLVNHSKKLVLDCWKYLIECLKLNPDGWVLHPLPLLTALGNGRGGGDYYSKLNIDKVGTWAWDELELVEWEKQKEFKDKGYQEFEVVFSE